MTRVLIADDHEVVRRGLKQILKDALGKLDLSEATTSQQAIDLVLKHPFDLVLLDINMPGRSGLDVLQEIMRLRPKTPVLMLSVAPEEDYALRCLKLGAAGYLSKRSASDELVTAVNKAMSGAKYVTPSLAEKLAAAISGDVPGAPHESLSNRELEVLRLIAAGKTIKEIATELVLSEKTVATYRTRLSEKMGLATNVELARYAIQHHLTD
ncbi:MAG TPA: response regulator transcription factor [Blastocatellia bacterium]|nr:response regulator transcription factor [Blastocatellia bacterium]